MGRIGSFGAVTAAVAMTIAVTILVAACGGGGSNASSVSTGASRTSAGHAPPIVVVYSSLPISGPVSQPSTQQANAVLNGIELAWEQAKPRTGLVRAGQFRVKWVALDDSPHGVGWNPFATVANARRVATDPRAVFYIGDFDSGASELSIPILNQAGIAQVSPGSTYVGLTEALKGVTSPGEPEKYYPTGDRTFFRIVPSDAVQAAADVQALRQAGCQKVAVANDKQPYGTGLAVMIATDAHAAGLEILSTPVNPTASNYRAYAASIRSAGADCFEFAGSVSDGGVQITEDVHAALPHALILGPDEMCNSSWTNARDGGVPAAIDPSLECTMPTLGLLAYPGGKQFLTGYQKVLRDPHASSYALFGYETMRLALDTIAGLGSSGDHRAAIVRSLQDTRHRSSVIGTYGFKADGATTLDSYGLYKVGANGNPTFYKALITSKSVPSS
jgi:branched-chain amino acid transport system substrate-binding protein